jgi:hypothetical protein
MFDTRTRGQGKTALVQICDQETILLVQVAKMKGEYILASREYLARDGFLTHQVGYDSFQ